ncbi:MAG TPA: hypothetical protein VJH68_04095 [Candidatus Nanoarchaeia archaeon]|nr:hypothetical protein [Candidatus Nanoarchaeia archaeon]
MVKGKDYCVYLVVAVALVAVLVIGISSTTLTGSAVSRTKGACSETDTNNDIYAFGVVNFEHRSGADAWPDECLSDGRHLKQYSCSRPNRISSISNLCAKGCQEGVCIK